MMTNPFHVPASTDHWWPKSVQREHWTDSNGFVSRKRINGIIDQKKPQKGKRSKDQFGAIYKGHWIGDMGPWSHSFERDFDEIDRIGPGAIARLVEFADDTPAIPYSVFSNYISRSDKQMAVPKSFPFALELNHAETLFKWAMSIAYRCPGYRRRMSLGREMFGLSADDGLGKANVEMHRGSIDSLAWPVEGNTKVFLRRTLNREFIFGDWVHETITSSAPRSKNINGQWHLIVDGFLAIAVAPTLLLQFVFDPFGHPQFSSEVCDVPPEFVDDVNRHMARKSEEIFFRDRSKIASDLLPSYQEGESGKKHRI